MRHFAHVVGATLAFTLTLTTLVSAHKTDFEETVEIPSPVYMCEDSIITVDGPMQLWSHRQPSSLIEQTTCSVTLQPADSAFETLAIIFTYGNEADLPTVSLDRLPTAGAVSIMTAYVGSPIQLDWTATQQRGWTATIYAIDTEIKTLEKFDEPVHEICEQSHDQLLGYTGLIISHPDVFDDKHPHNVFCQLNIPSGAGYRVVVQVKMIELEKGFDRLHVTQPIDGFSLAKHHQVVSPFRLSFITDSSIAEGGFILRYYKAFVPNITDTTATATAVQPTILSLCDEVTTTNDLVGVLKSHSSFDNRTEYDDEIDCSFTITPRAGYTLFYTVDRLDIEEGFDFLTINQLDIIRRNVSVTSKTTSPLQIRFKSDYSVGKGGFRILWQQQPAGNAPLDWIELESSFVLTDERAFFASLPEEINEIARLNRGYIAFIVISVVLLVGGIGAMVYFGMKKYRSSDYVPRELEMPEIEGVNNSQPTPGTTAAAAAPPSAAAAAPAQPEVPVLASASAYENPFHTYDMGDAMDDEDGLAAQPDFDEDMSRLDEESEQ
eukprot:m.113511 g.113511  ORF g.113511 m.113511 type:complete len:549 (+) comp13518_c0_seq1:205-1851(+)